MPGGNDTLYCSFCGKSQQKVRKLIRASDDAPMAICNECVGLCVLILREEGIEAPFEPAGPPAEPDMASILAALSRQRPR